MSYAASCIPIIMYCLGLFVVVYLTLFTNKYDQSHRVMDIYFLTKSHAFINPRRACAARVSTWLVCPSVCLLPRLEGTCLMLFVDTCFCDYAQRDNKTAIPTGSSLHWLHFKKGDFRITTAFKSYGMKSKSTSQYAN